MEEKTELKQQEKKAFVVGIGSIIAVVCLLIGILVLVFGGNDKPKKAKTEKKQEEVVVPVAEPEPAEQKVEAKPEPVAEPEPEATEPVAAGGEYEVQPGDTLSQIGIDHNVDWQDIMDANNMDEDDVLQPGDTIIIPSE